MHGPQPRTLYLPHAQNPSLLMSVLAKTRTDPAAVVDVIRREVRSMDVQLPVYDVKLLSDVRTEMAVRRQLITSLTRAFALLGVVLAVAGVYGVVACYVASRRRELGIRFALGARRASLMRLVLARAARWAAAGAFLGVGGSVVAGRTIRAYLFETGPTDLGTILLSSIGFMTVVLVTSLMAARSTIGADVLSGFREH